jgi:type VI secretion system protein ImpI
VILTLEVMSSQLAKLGGASRRTFREEGGSVGRDSDNSLVLPHPKVSGHHAVISHRNGVFYIEDRSTNGVCLNSPEKRLVRGRPHALEAGDRILIGPYEIRVSITRDRDDEPNPFDLDSAAPRPIDSSGLESPAAEIAGEALDPLELLNLVPKRAPVQKRPSAGDLEIGSPLEAHYQPPAVLPAPGPGRRAEAMAIPQDYNPLAPDDSSSISRPSWSAPPPVEKQVVRDRARAAASAEDPRAADFAAVLAGAGLAPADVTPELARDFGRILRVVVSGVMDVMRSRQEIKDEFRMRPTRIGPAENNPLKVSANVDDALHNLLVKRNPAYLAPVEAFEDAFADLRNHQIAMLAGMRVAFESMLAELDPDRLQQEFDRQLGKGLVPAKLRYWELFREWRLRIVKDPDTSFRRLFGDEFARAYGEQLQQLKARRSRAGSASSETPDGPDT